MHIDIGILNVIEINIDTHIDIGKKRSNFGIGIDIDINNEIYIELKKANKSTVKIFEILP